MPESEPSPVITLCRSHRGLVSLSKGYGFGQAILAASMIASATAMFEVAMPADRLRIPNRLVVHREPGSDSNRQWQAPRLDHGDILYHLSFHGIARHR